MTAGSERRTMVVQIGEWRLTGPTAAVALTAILSIAGALIVNQKPSWQMWTAGVIWIAFFVYWSRSATKAAPTKSAESRESRRVHTRLMLLAFALVFLPVPGLGIRFVPAATVVAIAGVALQALSFALGIWARRTLGRNWSAAITVAVDHELITSGPYRVVRHPIYSAVLGMFFGTAIASGTIHALGGALVMSFAYARKIRLEEHNLRNIFGPAYDEYRKNTWALIPGVL